MQQSFKEILNQAQSKNNDLIQKESGSFVAFELLSRHAIGHNVAFELNKEQNCRFSANLDTYEAPLPNADMSRIMLSPAEVLNHIQSIRQNPLFYPGSHEHKEQFKK